MAPKKRVYLPKSSNWHCVLNNPTEEQKTILLKYKDKIEFCIWQYEIGKKKVKHLQVALVLKEHKDRNYVKRLFETDRVHVEIMDKSVKINANYCSKRKGKLEGPWMIGEAPKEKHQGKRNDLLEIKKLIDDGVDFKKISANKLHFSSCVRYQKGFRWYENLQTELTTFKPQVFVFIGPTGIGKSYIARIICGDNYFKIWDPACKWVDGMKPGQNAIYDDYTGEMPFKQLLALCDEGPKRLEYKGDTIPINSKIIIFTSNFPPDQWYQGKKNVLIDAFFRRVDHMYDVSDTAPPKEYYFTKKWLEEQDFPKPPEEVLLTPMKEINWDDPIELDPESEEEATQLVEDDAFNMYDEPFRRRAEHSDNSNDEYEGKIRSKLKRESKRKVALDQPFKPLKKLKGVGFIESRNSERYDSCETLKENQHGEWESSQDVNKYSSEDEYSDDEERGFSSSPGSWGE